MFDRLLRVCCGLLVVACIGVAQPEPTPDQLVREGLMALQRRDVPLAQKLLEQAVETAPEDSRGWLGLAQIYRTLNLHNQALEHAAEAARIDGESPIVQHALSLFYRDYGNWAEAGKWEELFAGSAEADKDAYLRASAMYLEADMPRQAIELALKGIAKHDSPHLHNTLGKAYETAGQSQQAETELIKAIELSPYEESFHFDLGHFHLRHQSYEQAELAFLAGRKYFDKSAAIELGFGIAYYGQRRFSDAVDAFLKAAELAPTMVQPHAFLGRVLQHAEHRLPDVVERFRLFHEKHSQGYLGPFLYGQVLLAKLGTQKDGEALSEIEALLRESIERRDDYWESHFELGVLLEKKRAFKEAEVHLKNAVDLNSEASKPHYRLARVYQRLGKSAEAKAERELHKQLTEKEREAMKSGGMSSDLIGP